MKLPRFVGRAQLNGLVYLSSSIVSKGISVLLLPLYTAKLSKTQYGAYGLAQSIFWIAPTVITAALGSAFGRFFFDDKEPEQRDRRLAAIATPLLLFAIGGALLFDLLLDFGVISSIFELDRVSLRLIGWTCASVAIGEIPGTYLRASERAFAYATYSFTVFLITAAASLFFLVQLDLGLHGLLGAMCLGQASGAVISIVFVHKRLGWRWDSKLLREALNYSVPFIPHVVGTALMSSIDRWSLERYGFREDLGLFTLAYQLTLPIQLATSAWNDASSPGFLAAWRDGGDAAVKPALRRVVTGFLLASGGALLLVLAVLPLARLFINPKFHAAFSLVPYLGLSLVVGTLFSAFINVLFLRKNSRLIPVLTLASVAVNLALNTLLVPRYGAMGAIGATGVALAARTFLMYVFALRSVRSGTTTSSDPSGSAPEGV